VWDDADIEISSDASAAKAAVEQFVDDLKTNMEE
jgi:hypothetical protein